MRKGERVLRATIEPCDQRVVGVVVFPMPPCDPRLRLQLMNNAAITYLPRHPKEFSLTNNSNTD